MCYLNILNPRSASYGINSKSTKCFLWHQLLALLFIKSCGCLLIVYFSSVPTVMVGYDSKNICFFKEIFKSHWFFPVLWTYSSVVMTGLFLLIASKKYFNIHFEVFTKEGENPALADLLAMHSVMSKMHLTPLQTYTYFN